MTKIPSNDDRTLKSQSSEIFKAGTKAVSNVLTQLCADEPVLNENELSSIKALVAYAANERGVSEEIVQALVTTRFNVESIDKIYSRDFDAAVEYLVDINPKANIN